MFNPIVIILGFWRFRSNIIKYQRAKELQEFE